MDGAEKGVGGVVGVYWLAEEEGEKEGPMEMQIASLSPIPSLAL